MLTLREYRSAVQADHGTVRRFLAGCRCEKCDRPAHRRFGEEVKPWRILKDGSWSTST